MPFHQEIQQALTDYQCAIDLTEGALGEIIPRSAAVKAVMCLSDNKRDSVLEVLRCFLKNMPADFDPVTSDENEYEIYRAAILVVVERPSLAGFSDMLRLFFNKNMLTESTFKMLAEYNLDDVAVEIKNLQQNNLLNSNSQAAIQQSSNPYDLIVAIQMLYEHGVNPLQYTIDFLGCDYPLIKAQALILLNNKNFLKEGRFIIGLSQSPLLAARVLVGFKNDKRLMEQLDQVVAIPLHPNKGAVIHNLLVQAALAKLSEVMSEIVIGYMKFLGYVSPATIEAFVASKKFVYEIERGDVGIDVIWHFVENVICARMRLLIGDGYYNQNDSDLVVFVRSNRRLPINLNPVHQQLHESEGHYRFCDRMLRELLSPRQSPVFFKPPNDANAEKYVDSCFDLRVSSRP